MAEKKPFKELSDEEADKLISTRGNPNLDSPVSHPAPPQTTATAAPPPDEGLDPTSEHFSYPQAISRGLTAGAMTLPVDLLKFGQWLAPSLAQLAKQIPGVRPLTHGMREYAEKPAQSTTEYLAGGLGELLSGFAIPEGLLERGLQAGTRKLLEKQITRRTGSARPWVQPPGGGPMVQVRVPSPSTTTKPGLTAAGARAVKTAGKVGKAAEPAVIGGAAGAAQNKEDPAKGFVEGALAGMGGRATGRLISAAGRGLSHMGPAITHHVGHAAGIPYYARSMATHTSIPRRAAQFTGQQLERVGAAGRRPAVVGGAASRILQGAGADEIHDIIQQVYESGRASAAEPEHHPLRFTVPGQP